MDSNHHLALIRVIYGAICIVSWSFGNSASLHQRLGEYGFRTTATWIGAIKSKPYWMSIGRRRMARLGCGEEYTGNRSPIGRAGSDLRLLRLSTAGHRPFHVAHKTYLSSRKCLLICDAGQNGHSLSWNYTCNPNAKERVQGAYDVVRASNFRASRGQPEFYFRRCPIYERRGARSGRQDGPRKCL